MKMVGASLGDDVGGKPGVTAVLGAEVIRLHTELLDRVQRNILSRCRHERVVVLTAVEQIVTTEPSGMDKPRRIHRRGATCRLRSSLWKKRSGCSGEVSDSLFSAAVGS